MHHRPHSQRKRYQLHGGYALVALSTTERRRITERASRVGGTIMRSAFMRTLVELAEKDDRINLLVGDLGFGVVEPFAEKFPSRFVNAGVAEQDMTGIAAGLALCGKIVFTYSIANFPTLRCFEQIRNDVCYHNANVKVVSVGGGLAYGALGVTHHATEDTAVQVAERLSQDGIQARVLSMHTVKPLDAEAVHAAASETAAIVTIEEHSILGGLGSAVAEILAEHPEFRVPFKRLGLPPTFTSLVGSQDYLKEAYSLTVGGILNSLAGMIESAKACQ